MKYTAVFLVLFIVLSSCQSNSDIKSTSADSTMAKKPEGFKVKQLAGLFYDTMPCADCPGIVTKMYLRPDETFIMEREYIGKNTLYETGVWSTNDSLLQLTSTDSPQHFKIDSYAKFSVLDNENKEIKAGNKLLVLNRNNIPFQPLQPVPVTGMYSAKGDTILLHICSMNRNYHAALSSGAMMIPAKYMQTSKNGQAVFANLAGHFELRPSLNDTTTQDFFVIEKFISFDAKGACK